ncbi:MAG: bifunctional oligoribonuclease/PAP phosphatase NrnA [Lachnospiraceae bacterium]|nr:bifunctional oligoribonuclease/PAP phosphatase NrnA [Lachnospiraceae bacterium]
MNLSEILAKGHTIGISGHTKPDGDCIGSTLGLYNYIKLYYPEKEVSLYLEEPPSEFLFLHGVDEIKHEKEENKVFDVYFALDCGDSKRLGEFGEHFENAHFTACVDHHKSNLSFADDNYIVPEASSTSELIFNLMEQEKITKEIAECLYLGMVHDTGVFQYSCTHASTMNAAGVLMDKGIDYSRIVDESYYEKTLAQNKILAKAVLDAECYFDGQVIYTVVTQKEMEEFGVTTKDLSGIVNQIRITKGVEVAVFVYENKEQDYKVSMRSKRFVDVSEIAVRHGGGGHARAAGVNISGSEKEVKDLILKELSKYF